MTIHDFLQTKLLEIKCLYEQTVKKYGTIGKNNLIRSSEIIYPIHEFIKQDFILHKVLPSKIFPRLNHKKPELKFAGFLKKKSQDISVIPFAPRPEIIESNSMLDGQIDKIGKVVTDRSITVNVRSQLSSIMKNFDTLYERTFAESLNLHLRSNMMILGDVYLVPLREYDQQYMDKKRIKFSTLLDRRFPLGFNVLNNRTNILNSDYKYERMILLVVDFDQDMPQILKKQDLVSHGILTKKESNVISDNLLDPYSLVPDLLKAYKHRHGSINELMID